MKTSALLLAILLVQTCQRTTEALPKALFGRWIHSFEEDKGEIKMYRSPSYPFPAELGRDGFLITETGEFTAYVPGPADKPEKVSGTWKQKNNQTLEVTFSNPAYPPYQVQIVEAGPQTLKIIRIQK